MLQPMLQSRELSTDWTESVQSGSVQLESNIHLTHLLLALDRYNAQTTVKKMSPAKSLLSTNKKHLYIF